MAEKIQTFTESNPHRNSYAWSCIIFMQPCRWIFFFYLLFLHGCSSSTSREHQMESFSAPLQDSHQCSPWAVIPRGKSLPDLLTGCQSSCHCHESLCSLSRPNTSIYMLMRPSNLRLASLTCPFPSLRVLPDGIFTSQMHRKLHVITARKKHADHTPLQANSVRFLWVRSYSNAFSV